jgi:hypothetical protein
MVSPQVTNESQFLTRSKKKIMLDIDQPFIESYKDLRFHFRNIHHSYYHAKVRTNFKYYLYPATTIISTTNIVTGTKKC